MVYALGRSGSRQCSILDDTTVSEGSFQPSRSQRSSLETDTMLRYLEYISISCTGKRRISALCVPQMSCHSIFDPPH